jgi:hypothetical protein
MRTAVREKLEIVPRASHLFEEEGALEAVAELAARWFVQFLSLTQPVWTEQQGEWHLRSLHATREVLTQGPERVRHVGIAEVPGRDAAPEHRAVVLLRVHGGMQAVEIEAVEPDAVGCQDGFVVRAEPPDEVEHVGVPPHPRRESLEVTQRIDGVSVGPKATDVAVHAIGVGPVGLRCDRMEALLLDEALRELRAEPIELVGSVRGLSDQDAGSVGDEVEHGVEILGPAQERSRSCSDRSDGVPGHRTSDAPPSGTCSRAACDWAARSRSVVTSSSVVGLKSSYQSPTA